MSSFTNANYPQPPPPTTTTTTQQPQLQQQQQPFKGSGNMMVNGMTQQQPLQPVMGQQQQQPPVKSMQNNFPPTSKGVPNLNQFMPPTSQYMPQPTVGPPAAGAQPPTSTTAYGNGPQVHGMQAGLPGHLRPPGGVPLTNGGGSSVNSSRTASPALSNSPNHFAQQQQQQRMPPQPMAPTNNLSNSMQNLSLGRPTNGPQMQPPPAVSSPSSNFPQNFQGNFKTSALNTSQASQLRPMPPNTYGTTTSPLVRNAMPPQPAPYPTPPAPQQFATSPQNANYPPTSIAPPPNAFNQSQLNNNMVPPSPMTDTHQQQSAPMAARRPMYPQQQKISQPMQQPQQQQQPQAYPQQTYQQQQTMVQQTTNGPAMQQSPYPSVVKQGFNSLWGQDTVDLMQNRHVLSPATLPLPKITLHNQFHESINCHPK